MPLDLREANVISDEFGSFDAWRKTAGLSWHSGDDFGAPLYDPIISTHGGRLVHNGYSGFGDGSRGVHTIVDYGKFAVVHLHQPDPTDEHAFHGIPGQQVKAGDEIGAIGMTGTTNGPHSHAMVITKYNKHKFPQPSRDGGLLSPALFFLGGYDDRDIALGSMFEPTSWPASGLQTTVTRRYVTDAELSTLGKFGIESISIVVDGKFVMFIPGAPTFVNRKFPDVLENGTILIIKSKK